MLARINSGNYRGVVTLQSRKLAENKAFLAFCTESRILRPDLSPENRWNHSVSGVLLWFLPIVGSLQVPSVSTPLAPTCRACHISEPTIPKTPSSLRPPCVRHRSPTASHVSRQWADSSPFMFSAQFFRFGSQQSRTPAAQRDAPHAVRPSAKVPPDPLR